VRWLQEGAQIHLMVQGRALAWTPGGYREADTAFERRAAADAALDAACAGGGI